jgi:hypothetical protein
LRTRTLEMLVQGAQHDLLDAFGHQRHDQIHHALLVESAHLAAIPAAAAPLAPPPVLVVVMMMLLVMMMILTVVVMLLFVMTMPPVAATSLAITLSAATRMVVAAHDNLLGSVQLITARPDRFVVPVPAAPHRR